MFLQFIFCSTLFGQVLCVSYLSLLIAFSCIFFLIPCPLISTALNISSDDTFILWLDVHIQCQKLNSAKLSSYYGAILLTQCKMKFIVVWGHELFCLFVFSVAILSYKIMLCLVFIASVNVPNYFGISYQDHLWYFKCRYTYVFPLYLFKNSFLSDRYYYLMMLGRGFYIFISYILELNIKANNVAHNKSK